MRWRIPVWTAILAGIVGCSVEPKPEVEWDGVVRDSAGIQIVENFGTPLWTGQDRWTVTEVLRVGTVEGEPEYQFGEISSIAVLSDGTTVVADMMGQHLKFYTASGQHLRTVGKAGSGPQEFGPFLAVGRASGDTLFVMDRSNIQAHWLAPDGTWLGSWRWPPKNGWGIRDWDHSTSGRIATLMSPLSPPGSPGVDTLNAVLARDIRGNVLDTLARLGRTRFATVSAEGAPEWHYYAGEPDFDMRLDGGLVTGRSDAYRLSWYDADGTLERIVLLNREPLPFTDRDSDALMGLINLGLNEADLPPPVKEQIRSAMHFEDAYPFYRGFEWGPRESLWVQQVRPVRDLSPEQLESLDINKPPASPDWDVFDYTGRYLGVVTLPARFTLHSFFDDRIYGVWSDSLDVQHLVVMRIDGLPLPTDE